MIIDPIKNRNDIFRVLANELKLFGNACEIGVREGSFALVNLTNWPGSKYFLVDAWCPRPPKHNKKLPWALEDCNDNKKDQAIQYKKTLDKLKKFADRVEIRKGFSTEIAKTMPDNFFDIIYIDALHSQEACCDDLTAWYPKLKPGGLFSGDDYADHTEDDFGSIPHEYGWGVKTAVKKFCKEINVQHFASYANKEYPYPCWYFIKP